MVDIDLIISALWTLGLCLTSSAAEGIKIRLVARSHCSTFSQLDWTVYNPDASTGGLRDCDAFYYVDGEPNDYSHISKYRHFSYLEITGTFMLDGLHYGKQYIVQIKCGEVESNGVNVTAEGVCRTTLSPLNITDQSEVVEAEESPAFSLSDRDTILGIVFGLFGLSIISVSTYCIVKQILKRNRHERIRRYLGASLIDPFENLQNITESGGQQLMGSSESLS